MSASGRRSAREAGIVLGTILLGLLPFAGKPFHIDDVYFLEVAQQILRDPLRPLGGAAALEDIDYRVFASQGRCPSTFASMSHPPLVPYVIALGAHLAGGFRERPLHVLFVPFALGAGVAIYALSRRFTRHPLAAALLVVASPAFLLSGQSLMTDMPALALSMGSLALLVEGVDRERSRLVLLAGVLAGLAAVTRYATLALVPLLVLYPALRGRPRRALAVLPGLTTVFGLWCLHNLVFDGALHIVAGSRHYGLFYQGKSLGAGLLNRTLGDLAGLGGTAFVAAGALLVQRVRARWIGFLALVVVTILVFALRPQGIERLDTYLAAEIAAVAACVGAGAVLVVAAVTSDLRRDGEDTRRDGWFLLAWLVVTLGGALVLLPFGTVRYVLPALPPLWLAIVRGAESRQLPWSRLRALAAAAIAQGALVAVMLSLADAELAERYRAVALGIRRDHPGRTIWYVGEWGFRWYMDSVAGRYLSSADDSPDTGDLVIRPFIAGMHEMSPDVRQRAVRLQDVPLPSRWPVRLMSFDAKAGYYSHHWGFLPWTLSRAPLERIEVFEVRAKAPSREAPAGCRASVD